MEIIQLKEASGEALRDINALLQQLASEYKPEDLDGLRAAVEDTHTTVMTVKDGDRIIGMGYLFLLQTLQGRNGYIEDVIVDEAYRGQGLGVQLMEALITEAKKQGMTEIELTSRPARVAANKLYQRLGFRQRETNVYKLTF